MLRGERGRVKLGLFMLRATTEVRTSRDVPEFVELRSSGCRVHGHERRRELVKKGGVWPRISLEGRACLQTGVRPSNEVKSKTSTSGMSSIA